MKNNLKIQQRSGFTMIELLIVIVIMGILSAIGLGTFTSSQMKARDSKRKSDLRTIGDALEVYYNDYGNYPVGDSGDIIGCGPQAEVDKVACVAGQIWKNTTNETTYMVQMPEDPSGGKYYYISLDGSSYQIYAHLENDKDRDVPENATGDPTYYVNPETESGSCEIGDCNYGRSSSNVGLGNTN